MKKAFQYKIPRGARKIVSTAVHISKEKENLSGQVNGYSASEPEERLANASRRYGDFIFQVDLNGYPGQPGHKTLDFLFMSRGRVLAVEVDETSFIHRGEISGQDPDDLLRLDGLAKYGYTVDKIIHIDATKVADKDIAQRTAQELFE